MKSGTLFIFLLVGIFLTTCQAQKLRKFKKANFYAGGDFESLQRELERLQEAEAELQEELEEELEEEIDAENGGVSQIIDFPSLARTFALEDEQDQQEEELEDPCADIYCGAGKACIITEKGEGECRCIEKCENIDDERRKVCSNHNETWPSDCELYRMRCLCNEGMEECRNEKFEHVHIDYYGSCQEVPVCEEEEMKDFPRRMREWLFNIMRDMADRNELGEQFLRIKRKVESEGDNAKKWSNAAVWKWCELDGHPKDRAISRHELFPLRAPLYTLEHCIAPFLDSCDPDDDHYITLKEWSDCLELTNELTEDMEELCEDIRE